MDKKLNQLRKGYEKEPIPEELDFIVDRAISRALKTRRSKRTAYKWLASAGTAAIIFFIAINTSTTVAYALSTIPGVDRIVKVLTLREYVVEEPNYNANIKVPVIADLDNKALEYGLNEKYLKENEALYNKFQEEIEAMKQQSGGHLSVDAGYIVKTDNDEIFSIERYIVESIASSSEELKFDTIDKKNQILITLPMLFKDQHYIQSISDYIVGEMRAQMKADPDKIYWISDSADDVQVDEFKAISEKQSFYINNDGKLVIVFNKYEVAPGYMGAIEFIIPTDVISDDLVSHNYIK